MTKENSLTTAEFSILKVLEFSTVEILEKNTKLFNIAKHQIETNGHFLINNYKVYTPELAACFTAAEIEYFDYFFMTITGKDLFDIYTKGYDDGIKKYTEEWRIGSKVVYSDNFKSFMISIKKEVKRWIIVKKFYPIFLNYESIYKAGLNAGMLSEFYKFREMFPNAVK